MKAVVYNKYGPPEVMMMSEVDKPQPKANEVLVKIYATTVSAGDWRMRKADPFLARLFNGLFKPTKVNILGFEIAGVIEQIGADVKAFKPGDEVFAQCGLRFGGYAEYTCLPENDIIALKPVNMTFEEAAAVPVGGLTALRFLKQAGIKKGDSVLIYGASGSVGTFAVQLARAFGAEITAVCSTSNIPLTSQLGAHHVIDYTNTDFTQSEKKFDIIFDAVGKTSKSVCQPMLTSSGKFVTVKTDPRKNTNDLKELKQWIETGHVRSVIDRTYTLDQIQEAHAYVEGFHKKGNVVVRVVAGDSL